MQPLESQHPHHTIVECCHWPGLFSLLLCSTYLRVGLLGALPLVRVAIGVVAQRERQRLPPLVGLSQRVNVSSKIANSWYCTVSGCDG